MADTLDLIFDADLDSSSFASGNPIVKTTDASTSYVIKDVAVNNGTAITNASLTIEPTGSPARVFSVADLTNNNSGSLIVPPSSTVRIASTQIPIVAEQVRICYPKNASPYPIIAQQHTRTDSTSAFGAAVDATHQPPASGYSNSIHHRHAIMGDYILQLEWDRNGYTRIHQGSKNGSGIMNVILSNNNAYRGNWAFDERYMYIMESDTVLKKWDSTAGSFTVLSGYTSFTMSSYPRLYKISGQPWLLHMSSSGGARLLSTTTAGLTQTINHSYLPSGNDSKIFAAYDSTTDRLYVGTTQNQSQDMRIEYWDNANAFLTSASTNATPLSSTSGVPWSAAVTGTNTLDFANGGHNQTTLFNIGTTVYYQRHSNGQHINSFDITSSTTAAAYASKQDQVFSMGVAVGSRYQSMYIKPLASADLAAAGIVLGDYDINARATGIKVV